MTDETKPENNTIAIHPLRASDALRTRGTFEADVERWKRMIQSGALPRHIRTPEIAITLARAGEIYGWDPVRALRSLFIVEGRVEMWAQDMLALIREKCPEATIDPVEISAKVVTVDVMRPPQMTRPFRMSVTREQFAHVKLKSDKGHPTPWSLYPEDMLWARCVSRIGRRFFSDVTAGAYTVGELEEQGAVRIRQVGPKEVPMPGEEPVVEEAEIIPEPLSDCELCGGKDGGHADLLCPNRSLADEYTDPEDLPSEEGAA